MNNLKYPNEVNSSRFKYFKNQEGIYRVQITDIFPHPRYLTDTDLMTAVVGSHRTKVLNFSSLDSAKHTVDMFLDKEKMLKMMWEAKKNPPAPPPEPSDTFEEVD